MCKPQVKRKRWRPAIYVPPWSSQLGVPFFFWAKPQSVWISLIHALLLVACHWSITRSGLRRCSNSTSKKRFESKLLSADCKRGRKKGAARKLSKSVEKLFDTFWRFLTFFALRENCRKVSKNFLTLFDVFWRGPFPPAPFAIRWFWDSAIEIAAIWSEPWFGWHDSRHTIWARLGSGQDQESLRQTKPNKGPKRKVREFRPFLWQNRQLSATKGVPGGFLEEPGLGEDQQPGSQDAREPRGG